MKTNLISEQEEEEIYKSEGRPCYEDIIRKAQIKRAMQDQPDGQDPRNYMSNEKLYAKLEGENRKLKRENKELLLRLEIFEKHS